MVGRKWTFATRKSLAVTPPDRQHDGLVDRSKSVANLLSHEWIVDYIKFWLPLTLLRDVIATLERELITMPFT